MKPKSTTTSWKKTKKKYKEKLGKLSAEVWGSLSEKLQDSICQKANKLRDEMVKFPQLYLSLISICYRNSRKQTKAASKLDMISRIHNLRQYPDETLIRYKERTISLLEETRELIPDLADEKLFVEKCLEGADKKFQSIKDNYKEQIELSEDTNIEEIYPESLDKLFSVLKARSDNLNLAANKEKRATAPTDTVNTVTTIIDQNKSNSTSNKVQVAKETVKAVTLDSKPSTSSLSSNNSTSRLKPTRPCDICKGDVGCFVKKQQKTRKKRRKI